MAERRRERQIQMLYSYDRLGDCKISQVYRLLVPEKVWSLYKNEQNITEMGDSASEDSGNLHTSIIREAKRRTDYK